MRQQSIFRLFIVLVFILFIAININGINSFLSFNNAKTVEFGHSEVVVPEAWNTTAELNMTAAAKTSGAISNGYVVIDHWDDWPEDHITATSEAKFKDMENGNYTVLKTDNATLNGIAVSKEYFSNPSKDNDTIWNHVGVNYVFPKDDTNYTIQVHYFTDQDYNNATFMKVIDDCVKDDINNINNREYNPAVSVIKHGFNSLLGAFH